MDIKLFAEITIVVVVIVVGIIQWLKGVWKTMPSLASSLIVPILCMGFSLLAGPAFGWVFWTSLILGGLSWSLAQLCYEIIIQSVPRLVQGAVAKAEARLNESRQEPTAQRMPDQIKIGRAHV